MKPFLMCSKSLLPALAALMLGAGCSALNPFASDPSAPARLVDFKPTVQPVKLWEARIGKAGNHVFQPAVVGDSVYAAAQDGSVARFDNGRQVWRAQADTRLSAGVGSDGRLAVVVSADGRVIAYDAQTGSERWRTPAGIEVLAPPALNSELVSRRWVYSRNNPPLALRGYAGVVLENAVALAGFPGGKLAVISLANGGEVTELTVSVPRGATELERVADVAGTPVVSRREVCAVSYQGRVACFDASNGNALWARELSSSVGMDRDTRFAVITDDRDRVQALDAYSGAPVWQQDELARRTLTRPLLVGDNVVVGDREGYVHVLARESGKFAARVRIDDSPLESPPRPYGSGFVVQSRDGDIAAYELR
jgi:outer membrane protein assembly factor BamB